MPWVFENTPYTCSTILDIACCIVYKCKLKHLSKPYMTSLYHLGESLQELNRRAI